jgi:hypothetical protein
LGREKKRRLMDSPEIPPELLEQAERAFGDKGAALAWFYRTNANLGGARPLDAIELGDEAVVATVLDRLGPPGDDPGP